MRSRCAPLLLLVAFAGCSTSFPYDREVGGERLADFAARRVALVVAGLDSSTKSKAFFGTAAAVSSDGYFLTAAHVVETPPIELVIREEAGWRRYPARVVTTAGFDAALVKIARANQPWFEFADDGELSSGLTVAGAGFGDRDWSKGLPDLPHLFGGKIDAPEPTYEFSDGTSRPDWPPSSFVGHSCPTVGGDSGGPIFTLEGRLVGIFIRNDAKLFFFVRHTNEAYRLARSWVLATLADDRHDVR